MQKKIALFLGVGAVCLLTAQTAASPEQLLQRGREEFRAQRYADAANDLRAAADAILTPDQMKNYVNTGQFKSLADFETALVYLTLADVKLGRETDAKQQLQRLSLAEGIAPTYATLPLTSEVADFPQVAQRLMPSLQLPSNPTLVVGVGTGVPARPPAGETPGATQQQAVSEAQQRYIDQKIAEARAEIERRAQERIDAIQKSANEEIAAARAAAAQQQVAAPVVNTTDAVAALHMAAVQANTGQVSAANDIYLRLANGSAATRDVIAAAAVGLYRTGDFSDALQAFERLGTLARGEEDLRYYKAVTLFETGHYTSAKKELDCALPYIQTTDDVARYQAKIDEMASMTHRPAGSAD